MRNVTDKSFRRNQNTHFMFSNLFLFENRAVYEIIWKKYCRAGQATDDNIIWRMRIACWIIKGTDTHTHTICNTYCFSIATMVARTCLNVTLQAHCLSGLKSLYSKSCRLRYTIQHTHSDPTHFALRYAPQT